MRNDALIFDRTPLWILKLWGTLAMTPAEFGVGGGAKVEKRKKIALDGGELENSMRA